MKDNQFDSILPVSGVPASNGQVEEIQAKSSQAQGTPAGLSPGRKAGVAPQPSRPPRADSVEISVAAQAALGEAFRNQAPKAPEPAPRNSGGNLSINFNKDLGVLQAKVVDPVTHEVIREIPPDDALKMATRIRTYFKEQRSRAGNGDEMPDLLGSGGGEGQADEESRGRGAA